jgi:Zinc dependent phospholipase C
LFSDKSIEEPGEMEVIAPSSTTNSKRPRGRSLRQALIALILFFSARLGVTYSVQTHEQLIDLTWQHSIRPLLLSRYPNLTPAQLRDAHAYAYGGCAIQDLGYYPFGNQLFSDLTHYVRSGDFVVALLRNARTANELAFAIGALSHYIADSIGHSEAVNTAVPLEFPALARRYGPVVTYADGRHAHIRTEFAFDINEIVKHRFAPSRYLEQVGLRVPQPLLERAFFETYGLDMRRALRFRKPVIKGYRFGVRSFIPRVAYAEALLHQNGFPPDTPGEPFERLKADFARADFENHWSSYRRSPGIGAHLLAGLIFILPKIGVISNLAIRGPSVQTEEKYVDSLNHSAEALRGALAHFSGVTTALPNRDLDTGAPVKPGGYPLTDQTYARLLALLTDQQANSPTQVLPLGLKEDVLAYYADPNSPISTKRNPKQWAKVRTQLALLAAREASPNPVFTPGPDPEPDPAPASSQPGPSPTD